MELYTLPGIKKQITLFNHEIIRGINAMDLDNKLEILFGIDVEGGATRKEVLSSILKNIQKSDLTESEIIILTSVLKNTQKHLQKKMEQYALP